MPVIYTVAKSVAFLKRELSIPITDDNIATHCADYNLTEYDKPLVFKEHRPIAVWNGARGINSGYSTVWGRNRQGRYN